MISNRTNLAYHAVNYNESPVIAVEFEDRKHEWKETAHTYDQLLLVVVTKLELDEDGLTDFGYLMDRNRWKQTRNGTITVGFWDGPEKKYIRITLQGAARASPPFREEECQSRQVDVLSVRPRLGDTWFSPHDRSQLFLSRIEAMRHHCVLRAHHAVRYLGREEWRKLLRMLPEESIGYIHSKSESDDSTVLMENRSLKNILSLVGGVLQEAATDTPHETENLLKKLSALHVNDDNH